MTFLIWFFNKNHKHHHSAIIIISFLLGLFFLNFGVEILHYSEIYALSGFILSFVFFICGFYYVIDKKRKKPTKKNYRNGS